MKWNERFTVEEMPSIGQIAEFIANPLWDKLCLHLQTSYVVSPSVQYSVCSGAQGWNVKYRKGGRALCTLYPDNGFFTCLVTIGNRETVDAELLLPFLTEDVRVLYENAKPINGARWLMIPVTTPQTLADVQRLIEIRVQKSTANSHIKSRLVGKHSCTNL